MDVVADLGGADGWGRVPAPTAGEPVFSQSWQGRAFALALVSTRLTGGNLDSFRHALESLDRDAYFSEGYFGRWLNAAERIVVDGAVLAPTAVETRARTLRGDRVEEPAVPIPVEHPPAPTAPGSLRTLDVPPAFQVGQRVRAKRMDPVGHTRLPRYARGHAGVVAVVQPPHVFPDTNARFQGENPQWVYTVRFNARELWGAAAEPSAVTLEMFESYLEKDE